MLAFLLSIFTSTFHGLVVGCVTIAGYFTSAAAFTLAHPLALVPFAVLAAVSVIGARR